MSEIPLYIILGFVLAIPLLILNIRVAPILGFIDWPKARGLSQEQIPIVGHSLVLFSCIVLVGMCQFYNLSPWVCLTASIIGLMGHFDDRKPLPAVDKLFFQVACATTVVLFDPQIREAIANRYGQYGTILALFYIVGLMNAINFVDGIDGLAGLVIGFGAAGYLLLSQAGTPNFPYVLYCSLVIGMIIPFLYFNIAKRRGFLGNVGSYFFSYILAIAHLSVPLPNVNIVSRLSVSALCFLIPVADSCMVIASRLATRRSPFQADKGHLHHRLVQTSLPLRYILLTFGMIEIVGVGLAFLLTERDVNRSNLLSIAVCGSYIVIAALLILLIEKTSKRRLQGYIQRMHGGEPIYFIRYQLRNADGSPIPLSKLARLEARISAEIRISDMCFSLQPNMLFVALAGGNEPLRGIGARLENIFIGEKVESEKEIEQGEFVKVLRPAVRPSLKRA